MEHILVTFMNQWTAQLSDMAITNPILEAWLTDPSSTTEKFKIQGIIPSYHLQDQSIVSDLVWPECLCQNPLSRTVEIKIMNKVFMQASSLISAKDTIKEKIQKLDTQPLGGILFSQKDLTRSAFLYSKGPGQTIQRISHFNSTNLQCILVEAFHLDHPLLSECNHG